MPYVIDKYGCRLEIAGQSLNVRVRFRGSVSIPLRSITNVEMGVWRTSYVIQIHTAEGMYEWSFGDQTPEVVYAVREAVRTAYASVET
jgi:hypothetical protein